MKRRQVVSGFDADCTRGNRPKAALPLLEAFDELVQLGYTIGQAAAQLGVQRDSIEKALDRRATATLGQVQAPEPSPARSPLTASGTAGVRTGGGSNVTHVPLPLRKGVAS